MPSILAMSRQIFLQGLEGFGRSGVEATTTILMSSHSPTEGTIARAIQFTLYLLPIGCINQYVNSIAADGKSIHTNDLFLSIRLPKPHLQRFRLAAFFLKTDMPFSKITISIHIYLYVNFTYFGKHQIDAESNSMSIFCRISS